MSPCLVLLLCFPQLVAALVVAVLAAFVVAYWATVRDHLEAWHFQLTRDTATLEPLSLAPILTNEGNVVFIPVSSLQLLSTYSKRRVIVDPATREADDRWSVKVHRGATLNADEVLRALRGIGWRVLEQRFPRKTYVVIQAPNSHRELLVWDVEVAELKLSPTRRVSLPDKRAAGSERP